MALDFRLAYRSPTEYVDLFPKVNITDIDGMENTYVKNIINVEIPAVSTLTQNINITASAELANKNIDMYLVSGSQEDYSTITQYQVNENELILTRLYTYPNDTINVALIFYDTVG